MINISLSDITEVEYQIQAEGISVSDISEIRFTINTDIIYSFKGQITSDKVVFRINPSVLEVKEYNFCIEIITNYYFFKVLEDKLSITEPVGKVNLVLSTNTKITENKIQPTVRLKI